MVNHGALPAGTPQVTVHGAMQCAHHDPFRWLTTVVLYCRGNREMWAAMPLTLHVTRSHGVCATLPTSCLHVEQRQWTVVRSRRVMSLDLRDCLHQRQQMKFLSFSPIPPTVSFSIGTDFGNFSKVPLTLFCGKQRRRPVVSFLSGSGTPVMIPCLRAPCACELQTGPALYALHGNAPIHLSGRNIGPAGVRYGVLHPHQRAHVRCHIAVFLVGTGPVRLRSVPAPRPELRPCNSCLLQG